MKSEDIKKILEKKFPPFTDFKRHAKLKDDKQFIHRLYGSIYVNPITYDIKHCNVIVTSVADDSLIDEISEVKNVPSEWIYNNHPELKDSSRPWKN